jgi:hypothetical protein
VSPIDFGKGEKGKFESPAASPLADPSLGSLGRMIDEAQQHDRAGTPDDAMLAELGMTAPQFNAFIERYTQRLEKLRQYEARLADAEKIIQPQSPAGTPTVLHGGADLHGAAASAPASPEALSGLAAPSRQNISPEYRQHVEDYLRAVAATRPAEEKK